MSSFTQGILGLEQPTQHVAIVFVFEPIFLKSVPPYPKTQLSEVFANYDSSAHSCTEATSV